ncbi:hypothetical protein GCM10027294_53180 [Marinactinospora endophytica]
MPAPREVATAGTRRLIIGLVVLVVVLALALAVAVVVLARGDGDDRVASVPASQAGAAPTVNPTADGTLLLPPGNDTVDGRYPVNFERTPEGAVAMAAAYNVHELTLDPKVKARARQVYIDIYQAEDISVLEEAAAAEIGMDLENFGYGMTREELPTQADLSSTPVATVYKQVDENTVDVALMVEISAYDGISRRGDSSLVRKLRCVWKENVRGGDWLVADQPAMELDSLVEVPPDHPDFEASGWILIQGGI